MRYCIVFSKFHSHVIILFLNNNVFKNNTFRQNEQDRKTKRYGTILTETYLTTSGESELFLSMNGEKALSHEF